MEGSRGEMILVIERERFVFGRESREGKANWDSFCSFFVYILLSDVVFIYNQEEYAYFNQF